MFSSNYSYIIRIVIFAQIYNINYSSHTPIIFNRQDPNGHYHSRSGWSWK